MIMAGGTGGHVYPALAVAQALIERGVAVVWLGTKQGIEARIVPQAGIAMEWISVKGLREKGVFSWLVAPFRIVWACAQSMAVMLRINPDAVLGMGGFVSGPGGLMARLLGKPLLIHEQNAIAGLTNRWLAMVATCVVAAFPQSFPSKVKARLMGNPVRKEIIALLAQPKKAPIDRALRLLVVGGSLGAQALNEVVPSTLAKLPMSVSLEVWHQTGKTTFEATQQQYSKLGVAGKVMPYIEDMACAYQWADLVLCRAGAMTIAELAITANPSILVPFPFAVDDHQTANAKYLANGGAALLIPQQDLTADRLKQVLENFILHPEQLAKMSAAARSLAKPEATRAVADLCMQLATSKGVPQ